MLIFNLVKVNLLHPQNIPLSSMQTLLESMFELILLEKLHFQLTKDALPKRLPKC